MTMEKQSRALALPTSKRAHIKAEIIWKIRQSHIKDILPAKWSQGLPRMEARRLLLLMLPQTQ